VPGLIMDFKWKMNGGELVVHNKKTNEISIITGPKINLFHKRLDQCIYKFLD